MIKNGHRTFYNNWYRKPTTIIAVAGTKNIYKHSCPIQHFEVILYKIMELFNSEEVVTSLMIYPKLEGCQLESGRMFQKKKDRYKIYLVLGVIELEGLIKPINFIKPYTYELTIPNEEIDIWFRENIT